MLRTALVFLVIVLAGANIALYHYGRARPVALPGDAATPVLIERAAVSSQSSGTASSGSTPTTPTTPTASKAASTLRWPSTTGQAGTMPRGNSEPLLVPVQGVTVAQLHDTFSDARAQGRVHEAIDIMAPRGTPVLAVADGSVEKLFNSVPGGLTIYQFEPAGRYAYYYAHLDRYADGLSEKQAIRRGEVIGYVGSTGNADPTTPHLHFAIFELGPERQWWKGTAINPYPVLKGGH